MFPHRWIHAPLRVWAPGPNLRVEAQSLSVRNHMFRPQLWEKHQESRTSSHKTNVQKHIWKNFEKVSLVSFVHLFIQNFLKKKSSPCESLGPKIIKNPSYERKFSAVCKHVGQFWTVERFGTFLDVFVWLSTDSRFVAVFQLLVTFWTFLTINNWLVGWCSWNWSQSGHHRDDLKVQLHSLRIQMWIFH